MDGDEPVNIYLEHNRQIEEERKHAKINAKLRRYVPWVAGMIVLAGILAFSYMNS